MVHFTFPVFYSRQLPDCDKVDWVLGRRHKTEIRSQTLERNGNPDTSGTEIRRHIKHKQIFTKNKFHANPEASGVA
jgi:hypothetical protein